MRRIVFLTIATLALAGCSTETPTTPALSDLVLDAAGTSTTFTVLGGYEAAVYNDRLANALPDSLKLSAEQQASIKALITAFEAATRADREALGAILRQARTAGRGPAAGILANGAPIIARLAAAELKLKADIDAILTAEQRAWLASHAPRNCRPDQFPALTDAQKAQIANLERAFVETNKADLDAVKAAFESARGKSADEARAILDGVAPARARLEAARRQLHTAITAVLTPQQKESGCLPLG
ncbi:MAG TPA: lipoprotein [Gemmatimonadaceae bacterium]|nr:lipoprotein [Gemmatimonadaceae bacterium]